MKVVKVGLGKTFGDEGLCEESPDVRELPGFEYCLLREVPLYSKAYVPFIQTISNLLAQDRPFLIPSSYRKVDILRSSAPQPKKYLYNKFKYFVIIEKAWGDQGNIHIYVFRGYREDI